MSELLIYYWVSTGLGFTYIVGSAALGHFHGADHGEADGGDPGDVSGDADGGDPGDVSGDADGGDPGDVNGDTDGGDPGDVDGGKIVHNGANANRVIPVSRSKQFSHAWYFKVISLLSPTKLSVYLFFIGAIGILSLHFFPVLGYISLAPSVVLGVGFGRILLNVLGKFASSLHSSTNFKQDSLVGSVGELILSIEPGKIGEVVISTSGSRHSAPAKSKDPAKSIKGRSKVIICDHQDGVFLVEAVTEDQL